MSDVTRILQRIESGDSLAIGDLLPLVYDELRRMAATELIREKPGQSLQATALVHEAYLRLVGDDASKTFANRRHFFGAAAMAMRRILVDQARRKMRVKHGGELARVELGEIGVSTTDHELLALDQALQQLAMEDPIAAEVVNLKFFAGLGREAIAQMLGLTVHESRAKWAYARAWLQVAIEE